MDVLHIVTLLAAYMLARCLMGVIWPDRKPEEVPQPAGAVREKNGVPMPVTGSYLQDFTAVEMRLMKEALNPQGPWFYSLSFYTMIFFNNCFLYNCDDLLKLNDHPPWVVVREIGDGEFFDLALTVARPDPAVAQMALESRERELDFFNLLMAAIAARARIRGIPPLALHQYIRRVEALDSESKKAYFAHLGEYIRTELPAWGRWDS